MIPYSLAKQLKDAGFPQGNSFFVFGFGLEMIALKQTEPYCGYRHEEDASDWLHIVDAPTLSEMIEACNPFSSDEFVLNTHLDYWEASWNNYTDREEDDIQIKVKGPTPEIALAKLWLELNKK